MGNYIINLARSIAFLNYPEQGRSIFFDRRWTQINADAGRAIAFPNFFLKNYWLWETWQKMAKSAI